MTNDNMKTLVQEYNNINDQTISEIIDLTDLSQFARSELIKIIEQHTNKIIQNAQRCVALHREER